MLSYHLSSIFSSLLNSLLSSLFSALFYALLGLSFKLSFRISLRLSLKVSLELSFKLKTFLVGKRVIGYRDPINLLKNHTRFLRWLWLWVTAPSHPTWTHTICIMFGTCMHMQQHGRSLVIQSDLFSLQQRFWEDDFTNIVDKLTFDCPSWPWPMI